MVVGTGYIVQLSTWDSVCFGLFYLFPHPMLWNYVMWMRGPTCITKSWGRDFHLRNVASILGQGWEVLISPGGCTTLLYWWIWALGWDEIAVCVPASLLLCFPTRANQFQAYYWGLWQSSLPSELDAVQNLIATIDLFQDLLTDQFTIGVKC